MSHTPPPFVSGRPPAAGVPGRLSRRLPFFYGWVVVGVGILALICGGPGQSSVVAAFMEPMLADLGLTRSLVSGAFTLGTLLAAFGMGPVGRLTDRFGGRVVLLAGAFALGATCLFMSSVTSIVGLIIGFALLRLLVQGPITLTGTTLVAQWFMRRRGQAQSVISMGLTGSFAFFPPLTQLLIDQLGWRSAWAAIGLLIWLVTLLPIFLLVRSTPEQMGLRPDGDRLRSAADHAAALADPYAGEVAWTAREAVRTLTFWLLSLSIAVTWMVGAAMNFHQVAILIDHGHSAQFATLMYTVAAIVSVPVTFATGYLVDRVPARRVLVTLLLLQAVSAWSIIGAVNAPLAILYGSLNGVMIGSSSLVNAVIFAAYYGRRHLGSIRGITMIVNVAGSALGPFPLGLMRDLMGAYDLAIWIAGALPLIVAVTLRWARPVAAPAVSSLPDRPPVA